MNDEQFFLANAYLDGELTDEERRIAEADPAVMAEVDELRSLQASLRDVEPATDRAREAAIAAAMAEFGGAAATAPARPAPTVVPFSPRPNYARYLAIAAAAVGVGLFATVAAVGLRGADDDDAGDDTTAAAEPTADVLDDEGAEEPASELLDDTGGFTEQFDAADDAPAEEPADEPAEAAESAPAGEESNDVADAEVNEASDELADDGDDGGTASTASRVAIELGDPIFDLIELGSYGAELLDRQAGADLPPTPNTSCPPEFSILDETTWFDGEREIPIYVAVDDMLARALNTESCEVLLEAPVLP